MERAQAVDARLLLARESADLAYLSQDDEACLPPTLGFGSKSAGESWWPETRRVFIDTA